MKDGVDRRIDTVEQANLVGLQRQSQVGDDRFPQAVVLGVNADLISGDGPQRFDNAGAGPTVFSLKSRRSNGRRPSRGAL